MVNAFSCTCQSGFTGVRCETNINDCPPSICGNGKEQEFKGSADLVTRCMVNITRNNGCLLYFHGVSKKKKKLPLAAL